MHRIIDTILALLDVELKSLSVRFYIAFNFAHVRKLLAAKLRSDGRRLENLEVRWLR
jgi:hypothetical protein